MAQRRMFSKVITDSDSFLSMSLSAQALYFHLGMQADDDGFVPIVRISKMLGTSVDDTAQLFGRGFLIKVDLGVVVIRDWRINNEIRQDRYNPTIFLKEKDQLILNDQKQYEIIEENAVLPFDNQVATQVRLGKDRLGKDRLEEREAITPSQEAQDFFLKGGVYENLIEAFSKDQDAFFIKNEFDKFILYWTEKNKSGTRERWQQEPTFQVKRRLFTWLSRASTFSGGKKITNII